MKTTLCRMMLIGVSIVLLFIDLAYSQQLTERSFLFTWPGQSEDQLQLNLDEPIVTDRPDFTEASSTVGKNVTQFETGYTLNYSKGREIEQTYPELLLRRGFLKDWLELRLGSTLSSFDSNGFSPTRFNDLYLGTKIGLVPQDRFLPEVSIVPQFTLPTGSRLIGSDHVLAGANLLYAWDISENSYLGASTQVNKSDNDGDLSTLWAQSLTIGTSLSENFGTYFEYFAFFPRNSIEQDQHYINTGITYVITKDMQADFRIGSLLDPFFDSYFVGFGFSVRLFD